MNENESTVFEAAFERAGLHRRDYEAAAGAVKFIRSGGDLDSWTAAFARALSSLGLSDVNVAASKSPRCYENPEHRKARLAKEARELADKVEDAIVKRFIDKRFTADHRPWGSIKPRELSGMERDGKTARAIRNMLGPLNSKQEGIDLRELMTDDQFKTALRAALEGSKV